MKRKTIDTAKEEAKRFLQRCDEMERIAGWSRYTSKGNEATSKQHPEDSFSSGQYVAAVKRASLDLTRALADLRRGS